MSFTPSISDFTRIVESARRAHRGRTILIPLSARLMADQLTPVLAYRRLVVRDQRTAPSFLFESVENGDRQGRYSILGAHPVVEVVAYENEVRITDRRAGKTETTHESDPLLVPKRTTAHLHQLTAQELGDASLPSCMIGGWVGYASYDTVRYTEPEKLPFASAPADDRNLPDMHFGFYNEVVVFDHVDKLIHVIRLVEVAPSDDASAAYDNAVAALSKTIAALQTHSKPLPAGMYEFTRSISMPPSNMSRDQHRDMVLRAQEYIRAGDIFQVVLGQRFEKQSPADPFDVYRALRVVNPSPYMVYLQAEKTILVASSPEILCRVRHDPRTNQSVVTNRPLAGTRRRGGTTAEDLALEQELLADEKERAEHIMLVDLGRNDVGRVAQPGTIALPALLEVERYSHVMHISSTVTGALREQLDCWDALRATLPVGTISGAPKVRAMQIIDELEPVRRGPYGGGFGYATLSGDMDIALALRTIVVPTDRFDGAHWTYHLQSAGGIVFDSNPDAEYQETVNKAAAMSRAIEVAERAFLYTSP